MKMYTLEFAVDIDILIKRERLSPESDRDEIEEGVEDYLRDLGILTDVLYNYVLLDVLQALGKNE